MNGATSFGAAWATATWPGRGCFTDPHALPLPSQFIVPGALYWAYSGMEKPQDVFLLGLKFPSRWWAIASLVMVVGTVVLIGLTYVRLTPCALRSSPRPRARRGATVSLGCRAPRAPASLRRSACPARRCRLAGVEHGRGPGWARRFVVSGLGLHCHLGGARISGYKCRGGQRGCASWGVGAGDRAIVAGALAGQAGSSLCGAGMGCVGNGGAQLDRGLGRVTAAAVRART